MSDTRLQELAGIIIEKKSLGKVKAKWKPEEGLFTKKAGVIVSALLDAPGGLKKAMSRLNFYINRAGDKLENKEELDKAKELISSKIAAMNEEVAATARRAGIVYEKKKVDIEEDPEMDMDNETADEAPKEDSDEEEETLPKIVKKIAKKAVGKDVEELEDLIMKVYTAGHADGEKEAKDDNLEEATLSAKLSHRRSSTPRTIKRWVDILRDGEKTTKKEFSDVKYIADRVYAISSNEGPGAISGDDAMELAKKISALGISEDSSIKEGVMDLSVSGSDLAAGAWYNVRKKMVSVAIEHLTKELNDKGNEFNTHGHLNVAMILIEKFDADDFRDNPKLKVFGIKVLKLLEREHGWEKERGYKNIVAKLTKLTK